MRVKDRSTTFEVSWGTVAKVLFALFVIWAWTHLWQLVLVMLVSIVLAVAIDPAVRWLERFRVPRWLGSTASMLTLAAAVILLLSAGWSSLSAQGREIAANFSALEHRLRGSMPLLERVLPAKGDTTAAGAIATYGTAFARSAASAVALITIGMILTVYLLIEWRQTLEWVIAFVPRAHRPRVRATLAEAREIVFAYVAGNVLTSIFAGTFAYVSLLLLHVPAAPLLALIAGVCDFVPVLGFIISVVPAVLLASTVSTAAAMSIVALYITYHFIENYFIGPRVYGHELKLSNLAVLIAFAIGAELAGVIGALLALPVAASYPVIEKLWLRDKLGDDTVEKHRKLA